jgi:hypothetical protein
MPQTPKNATNPKKIGVAKESLIFWKDFINVSYFARFTPK